MSRSTLIFFLTAGVAVVGCNVIADIAGAPNIVSVTVGAPAGLLLGDSAVATSNALGDDGKTHNGRPVTWRSSDPAALPIDANGRMIARIAGRTVTISAEVDGTTGSATVGVASDDSRFGYALADQPTAAGTYVPDAATRYNSGGGTIDITRTSTGVYGVRFAGLGRTPGQRDNVQVAAYNAAAPVVCKPDFWDASGVDLRVTVSCHSPNGTPTDSRFTILMLGAWAFGASAPLGFVLSLGDTGAVILDSSAAARNSTGGHVLEGRVSEGSFAVTFKGLEVAWAAGPAAMTISPVGLGPRRCRIIAVDASIAGFGINCTKPGGGPGDAAFSLLWLQHGRPGMRFGFAYAQNAGAMADYSTDPAYAINSSGGSIKARKTALGHYRVVFAGLGRPVGTTETVLVAPFLSADRVCDITSWGNTGASDLFVDVACFDPASTPSDTPFSVLVTQ